MGNDQFVVFRLIDRVECSLKLFNRRLMFTFDFFVTNDVLEIRRNGFSRNIVVRFCIFWKRRPSDVQKANDKSYFSLHKTRRDLSLSYRLLCVTPGVLASLRSHCSKRNALNNICIEPYNNDVGQRKQYEMIFPTMCTTT